LQGGIRNRLQYHTRAHKEGEKREGRGEWEKALLQTIPLFYHRAAIHSRMKSSQPKGRTDILAVHSDWIFSDDRKGNRDKYREMKGEKEQ
jgi:hypothetical protein